MAERDLLTVSADGESKSFHKLYTRLLIYISDPKSLDCHKLATSFVTLIRIAQQSMPTKLITSNFFKFPSNLQKIRDCVS